MRRSVSPIAALLCLALALAVACGNSRQTRAQGQSPTPPPTPFPQFLAKTDADAVRIATDIQRDPGQNFASTGEHSIANLTSVQWVRTTVRGASRFFPVSPRPASGAFMGTTWDSPVWVFEFRGDFHTFNRLAPNGQNGLENTLYRLVITNVPAPYETEGLPMDLSRLAPRTTPNVPMAGGWGVVHTILPGQSPQIDALRANGGTPAAGTPPPAATATP